MNDKKTIYLFANWKMYLNLSESIGLAEFYLEQTKNLSANFSVAIFSGALAFDQVSRILGDSKIKIGAQNCYWVDQGGYTGEISARMYADLGCQYVLVGHSERRHQFGESLEETRKKIEAILKNGLTPVLCVGETNVERDEGMAKEVVFRQIEAAYQNLDWPLSVKAIIAYEPVWSIGTGLTPCLRDVIALQLEIKKMVTKILGQEPILLYGGSVRPENVVEFLADPIIDGVLVGGASTQKGSWQRILENVKQMN